MYLFMRITPDNQLTNWGRDKQRNIQSDKQKRKRISKKKYSLMLKYDIYGKMLKKPRQILFNS